MRPCQQVSQVWPGQGFLGSTPGFGRMCLCLQLLYLIFPNLTPLFLPLKCINISVFSLPSFSSSLLTHSHSPDLSCPWPPFLHCPFGTWTYLFKLDPPTHTLKLFFPTSTRTDSFKTSLQDFSSSISQLQCPSWAQLLVPDDLWTQLTKVPSSPHLSPHPAWFPCQHHGCTNRLCWVDLWALFLWSVPAGGRVVAQPARRELLWHSGTGSAMTERSEL